MTKRIRVIAAFLAVVIFFVVLFSALFAMHGAEHDCVGVGCSFCRCVNLFENLQKALSMILVSVTWMGIFCLPLYCRSFHGETVTVSHTPITWKIKLLN